MILSCYTAIIKSNLSLDSLAVKQSQIVAFYIGVRDWIPEREVGISGGPC